MLFIHDVFYSKKEMYELGEKTKNLLGLHDLIHNYVALCEFCLFLPFLNGGWNGKSLILRQLRSVYLTY